MRRVFEAGRYREMNAAELRSEVERLRLALDEIRATIDLAGAGLVATHVYMMARGDENNAADVMQIIKQIDEARERTAEQSLTQPGS